MDLSEASRRALTARSQAGLLSRTSVHRYRVVLGHAVRTMDNPELRKMKRPMLEEWVGAPNLSVATRRGRLSAIRMVIGWALDEGHLTVDPSRGVRLPRPPRRAPRRLPADDVARALDAADSRMRLILLLMVREGLRCVEVARLCVEDIDTARASMRVVGKGDNERELPIVDEVAVALAVHLTSTGVRSGPLFPSNRRGYAMTAQRISELVARHFVELGIHVAGDGRTAHALRHSAASDVLERCSDLRTVARMLGHTSVTMTERYTSGVDVELRSAMA